MASSTTYPRLAAGANAVDLHGASALMHSAFQGNTAVLDKLLDAGADIHAVDNRGMTVLMHAGLCNGQNDRQEVMARLNAAAAKLDAERASAENSMGDFDKPVVYACRC